MSLYEDYQKELARPKKKKNKSLYSTYLGEQEEKQRVALVPAEKQARLEQGLAVSTSNKRAAPTGLGNIIRGIVKPVADVAANAINAGRIVAGKETKDTFKSSYLGDVKGLGQIDITKSPFEKENLKVMLKSAATGAEIASYLSAGGVAKGTVADLTKRGILASKKTFAEWVVKKFPELAKEGFIQGAAYTTGSQGRDYVETGKPFSAGQAVKDIALSTVGNVVVPAVIRKGFGASTAKIAGARAGEKAAQEAEILGKKIPNAVTPETRPTVKTTEAFDVADKLGYNFQTSTDILRDVIEKTGRSGTYNVDDIIEAAKKYPPEKTPTVEVPESIADDVIQTTKKSTTEQPIKEAPQNISPTEQPVINQEADDIFQETKPIQKEEVIEAEDILRQSTDDVEDWTPRDVEESFNRFKLLETADPAKLERLALNTNEKDPILRNNWALSWLENKATREGDLELAKRLSYSNVGSKAGGELVGGRFKDKDSIPSILREIRKGRASSVRVSENKLTKEEGKMLSDLKRIIKDVSSSVPSKKELNDIINKLICK